MSGSRRLLKSFGSAVAGVRFAVRTQSNLRIHCFFTASVAAGAVWLDMPKAECAILAATVGLVITAELANTAIELTVDLASPEHHDLAMHAKDMAAGAVLCSAIAAVVVGLLILGPPLVVRLNSLASLVAG